MSNAGRAVRAAGRQRRRRRALVGLVLAAGVLAIAASWFIFQGAASKARGGERSDEQGADAPSVDPGVRSPRPAITGSVGEGEAPPFARAAELLLYAPGDEITAIAFHEASYDDAMEMRPIGRLRENAAKGLFDPPPTAPGPGYLVQGSRGRATGSTSAVDVMMPRSSAVLSPVDGIVRSAKRYKLYGKYPDWRVEIEPAGYPDLRVVVIHLDRVGVRRGDPVSATLSAIGAPRVLPFHSVVNDYVPGGDPHVHLEIKDLSAPSR